MLLLSSSGVVIVTDIVHVMWLCSVSLLCVLVLCYCYDSLLAVLCACSHSCYCACSCSVFVFVFCVRDPCSCNWSLVVFVTLFVFVFVFLCGVIARCPYSSYLFLFDVCVIVSSLLLFGRCSCSLLLFCVI